MIVTEKKLKRSAEHVYYEILMFLFTIRELAKSPVITGHSFYANAFLESFSIHTRNLLDFFYTPVNKRHQADDMLADDYISDQKSYKKHRTPLTKLSYIKKRVSKQVVHLTYHRNRYNSKTRLWHYQKIHLLLYPTIVAFHNALPDRRKKWLHFVELKKRIDEYTTI